MSESSGAATRTDSARGEAIVTGGQAAQASRMVHVSPHRHEGETVPLIMWTVVLALVPAWAVGAYVFGWRAIWLPLFSAAACMGVEVLCQRAMGRRITVLDGSAAVTGLLLAFVLPADASWYVVVVGAVVAIGLGKQAFGGLGANFFNPALLARAFLQFAFPAQLSLARWPIIAPGVAGLPRLFSNVAGADAVTQATPLELMRGNPGVAWDAIPGAMPFGPPLVWMLPGLLAIIAFVLLLAGAVYGVRQGLRGRGRLAPVIGIGALLLFAVVPTGNVSFGMIPGSLGETSAWALLLGGLALIYYGYIRWQLPAAYILTTALLVLLLPVRGAEGAWSGLIVGAPDFGRAMAHVFAGGLFIGAFFMITDMVTSPITLKGQVIFGVLAGVLVAMIRLYGGYPEGVCYSILLANAARPLIDRYTAPRVFGASVGAKT